MRGRTRWQRCSSTCTNWLAFPKRRRRRRRSCLQFRLLQRAQTRSALPRIIRAQVSSCTRRRVSSPSLTRFSSSLPASWGAFMASTDKADPASSESSHDGPETTTLSTSAESAHTRAQSPAHTVSSHAAVPDHAPAAPAAPVPSATCSPFAIPHPKRFNAVNINKKFLQKNSSSSGAVSVVASLATAAKSGSPARMSSPSSSFASLTSSRQRAPHPSPRPPIQS